MIAAGGLSGGLGSWATGGSFWDGLKQMLITSALNHAMHMATENCCVGGDPLQELHEKAGYRIHDEKVYDPHGTQLPDNVPWYEYLADLSASWIAGPFKAMSIRFKEVVNFKNIRNGHLAGQTHPVTGVPFDRSGFPDFVKYLFQGGKNDVFIKPTGSRVLDFTAANKAAGFSSTL